jgi:hypothetical protein
MKFCKKKKKKKKMEDTLEIFESTRISRRIKHV